MFQFRPFPSYAYLIQRTILKYCLSGFPHSEIHGYIGYLLLPVAYRSLSRPSSAPDAKAFPLRSFQLDLSNHLLILKVELCRQFNRIFEIVIVTHLYDVPQLKLKIRSSVLSNKRPLCCLAYHFFITLFSFQGSIFQLLLQPDLKICLYARSSNPTTTVVSVSRPPDEIRLYLALHARCNLLVGPSGLEPPTLRLSVVRSSQLSYGPVRRHKLHIPRRTACSTSRSFRCVSSSSQTRFAGLCSDFGRLAIILFSRFPQKRMLLWDGGDSRDRTGDLLLARQALSQLSYIPKLSSLPADFIACAL